MSAPTHIDRGPGATHCEDGSCCAPTFPRPPLDDEERALLSECQSNGEDDPICEETDAVQPEPFHTCQRKPGHPEAGGHMDIDARGRILARWPAAPEASTPETTPDGVSLIAAERRRHVTAEGWTPEHDDEHDEGEMARAAACYAFPDDYRRYIRIGDKERGLPWNWPWAVAWWKPSPDNRVRELVKAGALIAAEIDRLQRAAGVRVTPPPPGPAEDTIDAVWQATGVASTVRGLTTLVDVVATQRAQLLEALGKLQEMPAPVATPAPEVRALVEHCPDCHGKGEIDIGCRYCGDSTYDHECEERLRPCLTCKWVRDALAAVTVAPVPALVEEARRQFGPCVNYAPPIHCFHEVPLRHGPVTPCLPCLGRRLAAALAAGTASLSATEGALASAQSAIERDRLTILLAASDGVIEDLRRLDGMGKAPTLEEVDRFLYKDPQAATAATVPATPGKETT